MEGQIFVNVCRTCGANITQEQRRKFDRMCPECIRIARVADNIVADRFFWLGSISVIFLFIILMLALFFKLPDNISPTDILIYVVLGGFGGLFFVLSRKRFKSTKTLPRKL